MYRVEYLATQYRKECEDRERDREFVLRREPKYQENILRLQMLMVCPSLTALPLDFGSLLG